MVLSAEQAAAGFQMAGRPLLAEPYGLGHIHDTYVVSRQMEDCPARRYLLQRLNQHVFKNADQLMANVKLVTTHLRRIIIAEGGQPERETLNLIPTKTGGSFLNAADGSCWRAFTFIDGARTYQIPQSAAHVYHAGRAYGRFLYLLRDLPPDALHETIPDFHNTEKRLGALLSAAAADPIGRAADARPEIAFALQRAPIASRLNQMQAAGALPLRAIHNDTKYNNVMIDDHTGEGICVVDLDTVMPGLSLFDFGDAVRSIANSAEEDEPDLSRVHFSLERVEQFASGYLPAVKDMLTPEEVCQLSFSARLITYELGVRFLTDHLNGDRYFKTHRRDHNLDRCRVQFKLLSEMESAEEQMAAIIGKYI